MASRWMSPTQVRDLVGTTPLSGPAYRDLADRLRLQIVDGRLTQGVRLPSERTLALALAISRTTVAAAYARLGELGYLQAQPGSGNYVTLPRSARQLSPSTSTGDSISLTHASAPAPPGLAGAFLRASEQLPRLLSSNGYLADGLPELRERLAQTFTDRGLPTEPGQLIVTSGALSALDIVLRTLIGPGDRVLMESPTYPAAIEAVRRSGARLVGYPLGAEQWQADDLDLLLRQTAPRLAYLIPEFHNPTAATMAEPARAAVAAALQRNRTTAVIDETLVELALENQPRRRPLGAFLADAITIGSASKAFWGGLRIGWIRAPHSLVPSLIETRAAGDLGSPAFEQLVVAELLADPAGVLADQRRRLRSQRDHLHAAVRRTLPDWEVTVPDGGLSLWARLPAEQSTRLAAVSDQYGLVVTAGPRFFVGGGGERHLRLPYSARPRAAQPGGRAVGSGVGRREVGPVGRSRLPAGRSHGLAAADFRAALTDFLVSRTFCNESSSTMSATEAKLPWSPYGAAASRQPGGTMPRCLPSTAVKIEAFSAPKPGSDMSAALTSAPVAALRQTFAACPSYCSTSTRQTWCTRLPIDPGKRWMAGRCEHSATKSSSLMAAIAVTSKAPPMRWAITAGPLNAFSIGTCWSRTMPINKALSSRPRSASAAGSPVRWKSLIPRTVAAAPSSRTLSSTGREPVRCVRTGLGHDAREVAGAPTSRRAARGSAAAWCW